MHSKYCARKSVSESSKRGDENWICVSVKIEIEMNFEDYESLPTNDVILHMNAGAIAGIMEHCVMYPLDSVKTRLQSITNPNSNLGIRQTLTRMIETEGLFRPIRGVSVVVAGAGPAHALYFSCYESLKEALITKTRLHSYQPFAHGLSGCISTLIHDGIMTPTEAVKQRMQMFNSPYRSVTDCIIKTYKMEGVRAFYRAYTTQLTMNIPFQSIHFMTYEWTQTHFNPERMYNPKAHMLSGAIAGAVSAATTTPLDVCKTILNTQQQSLKPKGLLDAILLVYKVGGAKAYFRGMQARVMYQIPATAICWSTYEFFKYFLRNFYSGLPLSANLATIDNNNVVTISPVPTNTSSNSVTSGKTYEGASTSLPSMSASNLYGTLAMNTIHQSTHHINCSHSHSSGPNC